MTTHQQTALYRHFGSNSELLYVGISINAFFRLHQHGKGARWVNKITIMTIENFSTREEALAAEETAIREEKPKYNIVHNGKQEREARAARNVKPPRLKKIAPQIALRTNNNLPTSPPGDRWLPKVSANRYAGFRALPPPDATAIYFFNGKVHKGQSLYLKSTLDKKFMKLPKHIRDGMSVAA